MTILLNKQFIASISLPELLLTKTKYEDHETTKYHLNLSFVLLVQVFMRRKLPAPYKYKKRVHNRYGKPAVLYL